DEEIWRGGERGVEVTREFLEQVDDYLEEDGFALVILSSHADMEALVGDYSLEIVEEKKVWFENLFLARYK
ncbi:MAG: hypothetical protein ABEJ72_03330, partial [Candidatus Aenigmatarchaeota archaeon]